MDVKCLNGKGEKKRESNDERNPPPQIPIKINKNAAFWEWPGGVQKTQQFMPSFSGVRISVELLRLEVRTLIERQTQLHLTHI